MQDTIKPNARHGVSALIILVLLVVLIGMVAMVVDVGFIVMTKSQMQAADDSATLAGGTELLSGLGRYATKTPAEVEAAARPVAVQFAASNRAGEQPAVLRVLKDRRQRRAAPGKRLGRVRGQRAERSV